MIYTFNSNNFYDKKNSRKLIVLGVILLAVGAYCISRRYAGIQIFSWGMGIVSLYASWLCLKEMNELRRYAERKKVRRMRMYCLGFLLLTILLFVFPTWTNLVLSIALGIYLIIREIQNRKNLNVFKLVLGIILVISPLFLTSFLVSILSFICILVGISFLSAGLKMR